MKKVLFSLSLASMLSINTGVTLENDTTEPINICWDCETEEERYHILLASEALYSFAPTLKKVSIEDTENNRWITVALHSQEYTSDIQLLVSELLMTNAFLMMEGN